MIAKAEIEAREQVFEEYRKIRDEINDLNRELNELRSKRNSIRTLIDTMIENDIGPVEAKLRNSDKFNKDYDGPETAEDSVGSY